MAGASGEERRARGRPSPPHSVPFGQLWDSLRVWEGQGRGRVFAGILRHPCPVTSLGQRSQEGAPAPIVEVTTPPRPESRLRQSPLPRSRASSQWRDRLDRVASPFRSLLLT